MEINPNASNSCINWKDIYAFEYAIGQQLVMQRITVIKVQAALLTSLKNIRLSCLSLKDISWQTPYAITVMSGKITGKPQILLAYIREK